jgi:hypothetical protein
MKSYLWQIKDLEMDGRLGSHLTRSRHAGKGVREIAQELSEAGITVSKSTVAIWLASTTTQEK